jgi:NAD(P)-dependent dehydrogenase (short-subunit alcohol dehydrogenase family)
LSAENASSRTVAAERAPEREDELMGLLERKNAVVTGANSGIGLATAQRFIAEGAERVFITVRRQPELNSAAAQLGPRGSGAR